jgi:hypothetical protein
MRTGDEEDRAAVVDCVQRLEKLCLRMIARGQLLFAVAEVNATLKCIGAMDQETFHLFINHVRYSAPVEETVEETADQVLLSLLETATPNLHILGRLIHLIGTIGLFKRSFVEIAPYLGRMPLPWPAKIAKQVRDLRADHEELMDLLLNNSDEIGPELCIHVLFAQKCIGVKSWHSGLLVMLLVEAMVEPDDKRATAMYICRILDKVHDLDEVIAAMEYEARFHFVMLLSEIALTAKFRHEDRTTALDILREIFHSFPLHIEDFFLDTEMVQLTGLLKEGKFGTKVLQSLLMLFNQAGALQFPENIQPISELCLHIISVAPKAMVLPIAQLLLGDAISVADDALVQARKFMSETVVKSMLRLTDELLTILQSREITIAMDTVLGRPNDDEEKMTIPLEAGKDVADLPYHLQLDLHVRQAHILAEMTTWELKRQGEKVRLDASQLHPYMEMLVNHPTLLKRMEGQPHSAAHDECTRF